MIIRPAESEFVPYYGKYVQLVGDGNVVAILEKEIAETLAFLANIPESRRSFRYAPDKWSINEVVGHMIDTERVMSHRALRFARNDRTPLPGFEQDDYVPAAKFDEYPLSELAKELAAVRQATCYLFRHITDDASLRTGVANGAEVSVRALAYIIAGHELHHRNVLRDRYLTP